MVRQLGFCQDKANTMVGNPSPSRVPYSQASASARTPSWITRLSQSAMSSKAFSVFAQCCMLDHINSFLGSYIHKRMEDSMLEVTGEVTVVAIIVVVFAISFYLCLHLWFKQNTRARHQQILVTHVQYDINGLPPSVLKSIPVIVLDHANANNNGELGIDCAVCLCEVCGGEKARILPKCNHGFHVECIDMWLQSHSTCPLCRKPVSTESSSSSSSSLSTNLQLQLIDIPRTMDQDPHLSLVPEIS